jgi:hypothetical protein
MKFSLRKVLILAQRKIPTNFSKLFLAGKNNYWLPKQQHLLIVPNQQDLF